MKTLNDLTEKETDLFFNIVELLPKNPKPYEITNLFISAYPTLSMTEIQEKAKHFFKENENLFKEATTPTPSNLPVVPVGETALSRVDSNSLIQTYNKNHSLKYYKNLQSKIEGEISPDKPNPIMYKLLIEIEREISNIKHWTAPVGAGQAANITNQKNIQINIKNEFIKKEN
jgi:hypothetical protein